jgi:hypothetical protein
MSVLCAPKTSNSLKKWIITANKEKGEDHTEKYRTNEVQKKHPFLNLQKKMSFEKKKKQKEASKND